MGINLEITGNADRNYPMEVGEYGISAHDATRIELRFSPLSKARLPVRQAPPT